MAISVANLTSGASTSSASSYATASVSPGADRLLLLRVVATRGTSVTEPTVTGNGLTWVKVDESVEFVTTTTHQAQVFVFRAMGAAPSAGAITIDFGGTNHTGCAWILDEFDGVDTSGTNGSGAIVQSTDNSATGATSVTGTLAALGNAANVHAAAVAISVATGIVEDGDFTERADVNYSSPTISLQSEDAVNETDCTATFSTAEAVIVSVEVKAASSATLVSIAVTPAAEAVGLHETQQYAATGTYDDASQADITGDVTWSTTSSAIATITAAGLLTAVGRGGTTVVATLGAVQGMTNVIVPAPETRGGEWVWVALPEGYPYLLTSGDANEALDAHDDADFTLAIGDCLVVDAVFEQQLDIWDPFKGFGSCKLIVPPGIDHNGTATDQFGIDTHRHDGEETRLDATLDRDDTAITVASTAEFDDPTEVNIGIERIAVTTNDADTFDVAANGRGKYVPFGRDNATRRFAHHHRAALTSDYQVPTEVLVTEQAWNWQGRRVGLFLHQRVNGVLETRAQVEAAGRVWCWRIAGDIADDPATGATTIPLEHELDAIGKTELFRDQFTAKVTPGLYVFDNEPIGFSDTGGDASDLQLAEGYYTAAEILSALNEHLAAAKAATDISGEYDFAVPNAGDPVRCVWEIAGTSGDVVSWTLRMTDRMAHFLGLSDGFPLGYEWTHTQVGGAGLENGGGDPYRGLLAPFRVMFNRNQQGFLDITIGLDEIKGAFIDQDGSLALNQQAWADQHDTGDLGWGFFVVDNAFAIVAAYHATNGELQFVLPVGFGDYSTSLPFQLYGRREGEAGDVEVKQIVILEGPFAEILIRLFYSTGTPTYNHATHDVYGYGLGLGVPHEILGTNFINSVNALKGAQLPVTVLIDKPIKLADLIEADLIIRRSFPVWKDGGIQFVRWALPTSGQAIHTFDEDNKAEQVGQDATLRVSSMRSARFASARVTVQYNRSLATGGYRSQIVVVAPSVVDANDGKDDSRTLDCRNIYGDTHQVRELLADFIATHAYFAAPIRIVRRSISPELYFGVYPGEQGLVSDDFARDPTTGERDVADCPATIIRHMWAPPFAFAGVSQGMRGEVELALVASDRVPVYGPCAEFAGTDYDDMALTFTCAEHAHSAAADDADASHFLNAYFALIVEVDPPDPAAPLMWVRPIIGATGNVIEHDDVALGTAMGEDAFDDTKTYRAIFVPYEDAIAGQLGFAYQADNADARIQDLAPPFFYGDPDFSGTFTEDDHTAAVELPADLAAAEGASRDTGYERGHVRLVENLVDHKCAVQVPGVDLTETDPSSLISGDEWYATHQVEVFLGVQRLPSAIERYLYAAPWVRATVAGTKNWRLSLCSRPLNGDSLIDADLQGVIAQVTGTTSNTTGEIPDVDPGGAGEGLSLRVVDHDNGDWAGVAWLILEVQDECAARGIAHAIVGWREET